MKNQCEKLIHNSGFDTDITVSTFHTGKAIVQDTVIKIAINHRSHIRYEKSILPLKALFINLFKSLKVIFNTPIIR